jgi:predicted O-linked N-acetylglucosamine transferase (SPINDLY family)
MRFFSHSPSMKQRGQIPLSVFNNTGKLNEGVFDVWARILAAVPGSRLVLKWRTLADEALCDALRSAFALRGIASQRLDLRPASFHADLLQEYADIKNKGVQK